MGISSSAEDFSGAAEHLLDWGGGVGGTISDSILGGGTRHFFLLTFYNFKNIGGGRPPLTPRSLFLYQISLDLVLGGRGVIEPYSKRQKPRISNSRRVKRWEVRFLSFLLICQNYFGYPSGFHRVTFKLLLVTFKVLHKLVLLCLT